MVPIPEERFKEVTIQSRDDSHPLCAFKNAFLLYPNNRGGIIFDAATMLKEEDWKKFASFLREELLWELK